MATDVTNSVEDAEMAESEEDKVVTMMDILQEQEDFEDDANAVLGASDDKNCTYSKGYIKRQALYACMTCCSEAKSDPTKRAGLCLACSLICHENHELIELYTKRNFRCDCGNSKFNSYPCQLTLNKALHNEENSYNQNFSGLYCVCHRPYPDPNNKVEDDMIQCTICEDWLHASHLETTVPASDQYSEMICKECMEKNTFLYSYSNLVVNIDNTDVDIIDISEKDNSANICNGNVKTDKTDIKTEHSVQSQKGEDIDMSEKIPETSVTADKIEEDKNIDRNINVSAMINKNDLEDNKDSISCEKEILNESAEGSRDSQLISDNTEKIASDISESSNVENLNTKYNKIEDTDIKMVKSNSDNISEQNTSADQPKESDSISENKEIVDIKSEVTYQEKDNNQDTVVTAMSPKNLIEYANSTTEVTITNQNEKDEERMEEDRLLADPESEDSNLKSNLGDEKRCDSKMENVSSDEQISKNESSDSEKNKTASLPNIDENESNNEQEPENKTPKLPNNDRIESNNSEQDVPNNTITLPNNDKEETTKLENEVLKDPPTSEKATTSGSQDVENNELSEEKISNENKTESQSENDLKDLKATTANNDQGQKASGNTEQSTSNSCEESEPISQDKVTEKRKLSAEDSSNSVAVKKTKLEELNAIQSCICPKNVLKIHKGATFWPSSFRQKLCTCRDCLTLYKDLSVLYLIDPEDTVSAYESLGIEKTNGKPSQYEKGLKALSSLDRIQQINALTEYNKMRDKLLDFLKSFKDRKEIVKEEDIKAFFAGMKPTREPDGVYFCR